MVLIARRNRCTWYNGPFDLSVTSLLNKQRTFTTDLRISRKSTNYTKENKVKSNCTWVIGYAEWQWPSWTAQGKGTYMNDCVYMTNSPLRSVITCSAANWQTLRQTLSWIHSIQIAMLKWQSQYYHYSDTETSKNQTKRHRLGAKTSSPERIRRWGLNL